MINFLKILKNPLNNVMCSYLNANDILNLILCCKAFYNTFNELLNGVRKIHKTCPAYLNLFEYAVLKKDVLAMDTFFTPEQFTPRCSFASVIARYGRKLPLPCLLESSYVMYLRSGRECNARPEQLCICNLEIPSSELYDRQTLIECASYSISNGSVISYKSLLLHVYFDIADIGFSEWHCFLINTEEFVQKIWFRRLLLGFDITENTRKTYSLLQACVLFNFYEGFKEIINLHPSVLSSLTIPYAHVEMREEQRKQGVLYSYSTWLLNIFSL